MDSAFYKGYGTGSLEVLICYFVHVAALSVRFLYCKSKLRFVVLIQNMSDVHF